MAEAKQKTLKAQIARDFTDIGTGNSFKAKDTVDLNEGEHANYLAAGLLGDPSEGDEVDGPVSLVGMTKDQLIAQGEAEGVDLSNATNNEQRIAAIEAAR